MAILANAPKMPKFISALPVQFICLKTDRELFEETIAPSLSIEFHTLASLSCLILLYQPHPPKSSEMPSGSYFLGLQTPGFLFFPGSRYFAIFRKILAFECQDPTLTLWTFHGKIPFPNKTKKKEVRL